MAEDADGSVKKAGPTFARGSLTCVMYPADWKAASLFPRLGPDLGSSDRIGSTNAVQCSMGAIPCTEMMYCYSYSIFRVI